MQWTYKVDCYRCEGTGIDPDTGEACGVHSCAYNQSTGAFDGQCTAHCCRQGRRGPFSHLVGVQYADGEHHYDGVSEWRCPGCQARWGRWSGRRLTDGEYEPRFGQRTLNASDSAA